MTASIDELRFDERGLIPAVVQPIVFTLLTASFLATAVHTEERPDEHRGEAESLVVPGPNSMQIARAS